MPQNDNGSGTWSILKCFRCKTVKAVEMHAKRYPAVKGIVAGLREFLLTKEFRMVYGQYKKA
jgi:hypothetical protein